MAQELIWIFLLNIIINSLLVFFTLSFLIQLLIFVFRVKEPRLKTILCGIPILKLIVDPFLYNFQSWSLFHHMNPLEAETGSRTLSVMLWFPASAIRFSLSSEQTFTLADIVALSVNPLWIKGIVCIVGGISIFLLARWIYCLTQSVLLISEIKKQARACPRKITNQKLLQQIKNIALIVSEEVDIPCAFGLSICLPAHLLNKYSQDEFEAVIAHELDHLRWWDGLTQTLFQGICMFFWWVPSRLWIKYVEHMQECACDSSVERFNINKLNLVSAIIKTAKETRNLSLPATCFIHRQTMIKRIQPLLDDSRPIRLKWFLRILTGFIAASIIFGKFWIF